MILGTGNKEGYLISFLIYCSKAIRHLLDRMIPLLKSIIEPSMNVGFRPTEIVS